jgi:hypothetical protein
MKGRLPIVLSVTALVIAAAGYTSLGEAARNALPRASFANNADKVDGIHASKRRRAGRLYPLGRGGKFPASVIGVGPRGAPGVSGLEIVTVASATDSSATKSVTATCPGTKRAIGGGARATVPTGADIAVHETYPASTNQWTAVAREINPIGGSWSLSAYALCATVT